MEGFDILALEGTRLAGPHAFIVKAEDLSAGLRQRLVGADARGFLLLPERRPARAIQDGESALELGRWLRLELERTEAGADCPKIVQRAVSRALKLDLVRRRPAPVDIDLDGIERQLAASPSVPLHGSEEPVLAQGEELGERLVLGQAADDLARRAVGPLAGRPVSRDLALMLFAPVDPALRPGQLLDGHHPALASLGLAQPAAVARPQEITLRRVQVVIDQVAFARRTKGIAVHRPELEQCGEDGRVGNRVLSFYLHRGGPREREIPYRCRVGKSSRRILPHPSVHVLVRKPDTNVFRPRSAEHPEDESFPGLLILRLEGRVFFVNAGSRCGWSGSTGACLR